MHYVYVLISLKDRGWYIGETSNPINRLKDHNSGKVKSTKFRRPLELIYSKKYKDRNTAKKAERYYKSGAGRIKLKKEIGTKLH